LQSWRTPKESAAIFDIAPRTGYWVDGLRWVQETARHAHIYVFARHPVTDIALADHREPSQWDFYIHPIVQAVTSSTTNNCVKFDHPIIVSQVSFWGTWHAG
jgi:hypothetical protein